MKRWWPGPRRDGRPGVALLRDRANGVMNSAMNSGTGLEDTGCESVADAARLAGLLCAPNHLAV